MSMEPKQETMEIKVHPNSVAIVDKQDYEALSKFKWRDDCNGYVTCKVSKDCKVTWYKMHRMVMNAPKGMEVDHIDRNKLNNTRKNLRLCTHAENQRNHGRKSNNTSGYKGVCFHKQSQKWQAHIRVDGKTIHLGRFKDKLEAYKVYCEACIKYHGEFARTV